MDATPEAHDRRESPRYHVALPAVLRAYRQAPVPARMEDVSTGGALIAVEANAIQRGDEILLDLEWSEFVVTVAWVTEGFVGVVFHRPLHRTELGEIRRRGRARG